MLSTHRCTLTLAICLASWFTLRADEPDPRTQQELLLQQDRQKQIQAETDYVVRRMGTMLRVLDFYQLDKAAEKKMLEEMAGVLGGLSKTQMREVIQRLEAAAKATTAEQSNKEVEAAYGRHREILENLKFMLARYDAIRNLDQAADRLEKQSVQQLELHFQTEQLARDAEALQKPTVSPTQRLIITTRLRGRGVNFNRYADDQSDLNAEVSRVLSQVKELRAKLNEEQLQRVALMEKLAAEHRLRENMQMAAQKLRLLDARRERQIALIDTTDLQWKSAGHLKELARVLRLPGEMLALLREARDRVDQAISKQTELNELTKKETPHEPTKEGASKNEAAKIDGPKKLTFPDTSPLLDFRDARTAFYPREALDKAVKDAQSVEKLNELGKQQARVEFETKDTADLVKPIAKDAAQKLQAAEKAMGNAKDALAKADVKQATQPQNKATDELKAAKQELDKMIAALEKQKNDPLAALKNVAEKLDKIIKDQTETHDQTKQSASDKQNLKAPQLAAKQKELAIQTNQLKDQPLPAKEKVEPALAKAEKAMKEAAAKLDKKQSPDAVPKQELALKNLEDARKELGDKIAEMEKRRDDLAKLEDAAKKLDELTKQEGKVAELAKDLTKKPEPTTSKQLAKDQEKITPQASDLAKELQKAAPEAAQKVDESTKNMQAAKQELEKNQPMPGAQEAKLATNKLQEAQKALAKAMDELKAKEIADQAALQPKTTDPAAAAQQLAKALEQTEKAAMEAKAAEQGQQNPDLAKMQADIAKEAGEQKLPETSKDAAKAAEALKQNELLEALKNQEKALAKLQDAAEKAPMTAKPMADTNPPLAAEAKPMPGEAKPAATAKAGEPMASEAKNNQAQPAQAKNDMAKAAPKPKSGQPKPGTAKPAAMAKSGTKPAEPKANTAQAGESKAAPPNAKQSKAGEKPAQAKAAPKGSQPKSGEAKPVTAQANKAGQPMAKATPMNQTGQPKGEAKAQAMAKAGDAKAGEPMSGDAKNALAKAGDAKQGQSMSGQAKAAATGQGRMPREATAQAKTGQTGPPKSPAQLAQAQKDLMDATQALAKSQEATQAAQAALAQAQAQAPKTVQPQLQEASKQLAQANQQLQNTAPSQAAEAQQQAAQQLGKALDTLNAALAQQNQPPVQPGQPATAKGNPMTAKADGKDGQPMPGENGEPGMGDPMGQGKDGKGDPMGQGKPMPGQPGKGQEKNEKKGTGDRTPDGKVANAKSQFNDVNGDGSFLHLPPRQRELIRQALAGTLPPEYAAVIQQYYINIARGKMAPGATAPSSPNR